MISFKLKTSQKRQVVDITEIVRDFIVKENFEKGLCHLFLTHTTCAIAVIDLDPGSDLDFISAFENIVPKLNFSHPHDPAHFGDHLLSSLVGVSILIPVESSNLVLGQWQKIALIEFSGPREREIKLSLINTI